MAKNQKKKKKNKFVRIGVQVYAEVENREVVNIVRFWKLKPVPPHHV